LPSFVIVVDKKVKRQSKQCSTLLLYLAVVVMCSVWRAWTGTEWSKIVIWKFRIYVNNFDSSSWNYKRKFASLLLVYSSVPVLYMASVQKMTLNWLLFLSLPPFFPLFYLLLFCPCPFVCSCSSLNFSSLFLLFDCVMVNS